MEKVLRVISELICWDLLYFLAFSEDIRSIAEVGCYYRQHGKSSRDEWLLRHSV